MKKFDSKIWECLACKKDCFNDPKDYYMLHDELWLMLNPKKDGMLCMDCVEQKLGRPLKKEDILICKLTEKINPYTAAIIRGQNHSLTTAPEGETTPF